MIAASGRSRLAGAACSSRPDRVLIDERGSVRVQRIRTGKKTKSEAGKRIYALLRKGAQQKYPGRHVSIEAFYLATGECHAGGGEKRR